MEEEEGGEREGWRKGREGRERKGEKEERLKSY